MMSPITKEVLSRELMERVWKSGATSLREAEEVYLVHNKLQRDLAHQACQQSRSQNKHTAHRSRVQAADTHDDAFLRLRGKCLQPEAALDLDTSLCNAKIRSVWQDQETSSHPQRTTSTPSIAVDASEAGIHSLNASEIVRPGPSPTPSAEASPPHRSQETSDRHDIENVSPYQLMSQDLPDHIIKSLLLSPAQALSKITRLCKEKVLAVQQSKSGITRNSSLDSFRRPTSPQASQSLALDNGNVEQLLESTPCDSNALLPKESLHQPLDLDLLMSIAVDAGEICNDINLLLHERELGMLDDPHGMSLHQWQVKLPGLRPVKFQRQCSQNIRASSRSSAVLAELGAS